MFLCYFLIFRKEIKNNQNINYITNHNCTLHYNRNKNRFTLLVQKDITINKKEKYYTIAHLKCRFFINKIFKKDNKIIY